MSRKKLHSKKKNDKKWSRKKSINTVLPVIRNNKIWGWTWEYEMASFTHVPVQLTDSTPTRSSTSVNVGERGTTVNWRLTFTAPHSALCHRVVGAHYCCRAAAGAYTHAALRCIRRSMGVA